MHVSTAQLIMNDGNQAVLLPAEFRFEAVRNIGVEQSASTRVTHTLYHTEVEVLALVAGDVEAFHLDVGEAAQGCVFLVMPVKSG